MRWATRGGIHIDRGAACARLIRRFIGAAAEFDFDADLTEVPSDATPFHIPRVDVSHHSPAPPWAPQHSVSDGDRAPELTGPLFDGAYEFLRRQLMPGRAPA